jgi:hypothetical protein
MNQTKTTSSAAYAELDSRILGYDTYYPECGKYYFPDNFTELAWLTSERPAIMEVSYGEMVKYLRRGCLLGLASDLGKVFKAIFEADDRNTGLILNTEENHGALTLSIERLEWRPPEDGRDKFSNGEYRRMELHNRVNPEILEPATASAAKNASTNDGDQKPQ